ncbi:MAG: LemA family protein [Patescibacteria group bacterium]|nr:LemA family protein [Patescibacteria group bacterium]MCL5113863.1 LemA family protein [Patescibacteria group bacterium]
MLEAPFIITVLILVSLLYLFFSYNSLVVLRERIKEALSQIDVQLKRRTDLIPNLVETVKGYAKHEKEVFEQVTKARASLMSAESLKEKADANNQLSNTLKSLFAVAENYPELKASQNFLELQEELTDTENKISYARQFYNSNVLAYNSKIKSFPIVLLANSLGFKEQEFFEAEEGEKQPVKVSF